MHKQRDNDGWLPISFTKEHSTSHHIFTAQTTDNHIEANRKPQWKARFLEEFVQWLQSDERFSEEMRTHLCQPLKSALAFFVPCRNLSIKLISNQYQNSIKGTFDRVLIYQNSIKSILIGI